MTTELQIIDERTILNKSFRVYGTLENPLFLAKDIASWIEYDSDHISELLNLVDDSEKTKITIKPANGNVEFGDSKRNLPPISRWFVTEDGLYEILMLSRKPIAKEFKKIVKEILKSIRKHGAYMTPNTIERALTDPDFLIELATKLKEERSKRNQAENEVKILEEERLKALPKIQVFDSIINQNGLFSIRNTAKTLQVPERRFIEFLIDKKIVFRNSQSILEPYSKTIEKNLMEIKLIETDKGGAKSQAKFTAKGQAWISLLADKYSNYFLTTTSSSHKHK